MIKMTNGECRKLIDAMIRTKARCLVAFNKNTTVEGMKSSDWFKSLPFGLEDVKQKDDGSIDLSDLATKIHDEIIERMRWGENQDNPILVGIREIGSDNFTPDYVKSIIKGADLQKALQPEEIDFFDQDQDAAVTMAKAKTHKIVQTKDHRTGEMVDLKIPNYDDGEDAGDKDAKSTTPDENHVGKKVYFNPGGQAIMAGKVTGHGKHGITIRDPKGKKHLIEHGKYQIHAEDNESGDFGAEDHGEEMKKSVADTVWGRLAKAKKEMFQGKPGMVDLFEKWYVDREQKIRRNMAAPRI
jgi:hypothetical protein